MIPTKQMSPIYPVSDLPIILNQNLETNNFQSFIWRVCYKLRKTKRLTFDDPRKTEEGTSLKDYPLVTDLHLTPGGNEPAPR